MSTRAVYSFKDQLDTYHVYKHHDGYPTGAAEWIANALKNAWPLPRFEADEFAAAFVAANKGSPGGVRLTSGPSQHGDLEYRYEISLEGQNLIVRAFSVSDTDREIFVGTLPAFAAWAEKESS